MTWVLPILVLVMAAAVIGLAALRPIARRWKWRRQLAGSEAEVAAAMADGRLSRATGEALLQHLEGLRRECSRDRET